MSGAVASAPPPPQRAATQRPVTPMPGTAPRPRRSLATPDILRRISLVVAGVCVVAGLVGTALTSAYEGAAQTVRDNTGPVLVTTQSLLASLAEADAAATAAFVSGVDEDPIARRSYLDALERATGQVEQVSGLIGDDRAAHEALQDLGTNITRYASLVEAARATNLAGLGDEGRRYLVDAIALLDGDVREATGRLETATRLRLDDDGRRLQDGIATARLALLLALGALVAGQVALAARTRRMLNVPLLLATAAVAGATLWSVSAVGAAGDDFFAARTGGFDAIAASAEVQDQAFRAKGAETVALITRSSSARVRADELLGQVQSSLSGLPFDSAREGSRLAEAEVRLGRYLDAVRRLRAAGSEVAEIDLVVGPLSQAFNGFTFQMEGVLADNQDQFLSGLDQAASRTSGLPLGVLLLPLLAGILALVGFQQRIGEYR